MFDVLRWFRGCAIVKAIDLGICHQQKGTNCRPEQHFKCRLVADTSHTPPPESRDRSRPVSVYSPGVISNEMTWRYRPQTAGRQRRIHSLASRTLHCHAG